MITFCEFVTFYCHRFWLFVFKIFPKSNRIKSYRKNKTKIIRFYCKSDFISFEPKRLIQYNQIRFDFDSIGQPWRAVVFVWWDCLMNTFLAGWFSVWEIFADTQAEISKQYRRASVDFKVANSGSIVWRRESTHPPESTCSHNFLTFFILLLSTHGQPKLIVFWTASSRFSWIRWGHIRVRLCRETAAAQNYKVFAEPFTVQTSNPDAAVSGVDH